jgi:hypothetical protein
MKHLHVFSLFLLIIPCVFAQERKTVIQPASDSFAFVQDTSYRLDSLASDSVYRIRHASVRFGLIDSIANDTQLHMILYPYRQITNYYRVQPGVRLNLPTVKEIQPRQPRNGQWKFWIISFILFYISFVRISNQNNFRVFILSVFNLKLSSKIWDEQRSVFSFVILQMFAIYLFIAALFINYFLELKAYNPMHSYFTQYMVIFGLITLIYAGKFIIHWLLGVILKMNRLGIGFVANTVSVNNFLSLIILPFIIFIIYNENRLLTLILSQTVIAIFFISVFYRMIRITILSHSFFSFPKVYLFIYLCALEVTPWFVIIKFINQFQI